MDSKPFGVVVRDLLLEHGYVTKLGNPYWVRFARELPVHYETLRKAVVGERPPGGELMNQVARFLGIDPTRFFEYQLLQARKAFDTREVGADRALENLAAWSQLGRLEGGGPAFANDPRTELESEA